MTGLIARLLRRSSQADEECAGCGAVMARTDLACPEGCGFDRRNQRRLSGGAWARLDRL
ncbi:MAG TPA: hypothetical protein VFR56_04400 [Actinomycetes bacterium]|nr:hypothetical protein [Actinomycetes bacterium]